MQLSRWRRRGAAVLMALAPALMPGGAASGQPRFVAAEVEAAVENGPLRGTLLVPGSGALAVAVIVPGSGPTDRDGNNPLGITAGTYRMLAEALAERGIASIRYDKRGLAGSAGSFADPNAVTVADLAGDALAWVDVARRETGLPCAFLAGHSEGGLVSLFAAQGQPAVCGLILISAPGRRLSDVLREQLWSNPANWTVLPDALAAIAALERGEKVDVSGFHEALQRLFHPAVQGFLIDLFRHDPAALAASATQRMVIVQGGRDIQVKQTDGDALAAAQPRAEKMFLAAMNHVLKDVPPDDPAANIASYSDPDLPLARGLVQGIADFMLRSRLAGAGTRLIVDPSCIV